MGLPLKKMEDAMKTVLLVIFLVSILTACSPTTKKGDAALKKPVDCTTAEEDLRTLEEEKKNVAQQTAAGITAVLPIGLVVHSAKGEEGDTVKVATGEYDEMIDAKIAQIKSECGIE